MKNKVFIYCFALFAFTFSCEDATQTEVIMVSAEEMQELLELEDIQLVDVRTLEEYKTGFIEQAQNIDYTSPTFEEDLVKLDKSKPIMVYCKSGIRSGKCSKKLKEAGFIKVYDLEGGITQWKFSGYEIKAFE
ncbi:rhodanese-like domain-containing protein [Psychroserpens burtonensis]|uniref:Rhodanese-like domain-containing protein n=1 Tax=Psychroserpens burtonensis TaxID=49278 RepID=A0A5C7BCL1_9FLAO|nr:rhodanese-like domain-containing protein [Psychroserpens burtonensis]TXE16705.1 rhodanese-like domain-containing protein [Psychroserpens burtonensis]